MKKTPLLLFVLVGSFFSCNQAKKDPIAKQKTEKEEVVTVKHFPNPSTLNSQTPRLFSNGGQLYFSWVAQQGSISTLYSSVFENGAWRGAVQVNSGEDWFTNWADFPAIAENNGNILTHFLQKSASGTYTYDIKLNLFSAGAQNWKKGFTPHSDGTESEHGFVSMLPHGKNDFLITWLDGRNTVGENKTQDTHTHGMGPMTLRAAFVNSDGTITNSTQLDGRVCECCGTAATNTEKGPMIAYRDRSDTEIRDISVVRYDKTNGWSEPQTIGKDRWEIAGCPVNGPAMDALGNNVVLTWFTATTGAGDVKVAFSKDSGETFGPPFRIDVGNAIGRVDCVMLNEEKAAVLWMEPKGADTVILLMEINNHGYTQPPITIARTSAERASGFPQLEKLGDQLFIAWTDVSGGASTIKTAVVQVADLNVE
ncbi:MAG: hypothetical protein ACPGQR_07880, partial [Marinirhabdus sp.]